MFPENETFAGEIERSIINVGIANPDRNGQGVRYFALLHKNKQEPSNHGTCCEGQSTRLIGSVPEHLVSYSAQGPFWDLYFASNASWDLGTHGGPGPTGHVLRVNVTSNYPYDGQVAMQVWVEAPAVEFADASRETPTAVDVDLALRIPSWSQGTVKVSVQGARVQSGTSLRSGFEAGKARSFSEEAGPSTHSGTPGTYLHLKQSWPVGGPADAALIQFDLQMGWRVTKYTGLTTVEGQDRWAYEYGPVLLAMTGAWDPTLGGGVEWVQGEGAAIDPTRPQDWTELDGSLGGPLQFRVKNATVRDGPVVKLMPYMDVDEEIFDVYSVVG